MNTQRAIPPCSPPLEPRVLDEAAGWAVRIYSGEASAEDRQALDAWCMAHPAHALAWQRAQKLFESLHALPAGLGNATLRHQPQQAQRRAMLRLLTLALATPAAGWWVSQSQPVRAWRSDLRTATGERRHLTLDDGTQLTLNAGSAVDVRFEDGQRVLVLHQGDILVDTGADAQAAAYRPFLVMTQQGVIRALGTQFTVRQHNDVTRVAVLQDRVQLQPAQGQGNHPIVSEGGWATFDRHGVLDTGGNSSAEDAWTRGTLVASRMRLGDVIQELGRYHRGWLRCDPDVADRIVSGVFSLDDVAHSLEVLQASFNLRVRNWSGWVVLIEAG